MSTTTYQNTHHSRLIRRRNSQTSMTTNEHRSQYPLRTNNFLTPIPPIGESLAINTTNVKRSLSSRHRLDSNEKLSSSSKSSQQIYTFSSPPCELQRKRALSASQRVSSAPDESSPRPRLNQPKPSSASESLRARLSDQINTRSKQSKDEQQKDSLNALLRQQEKSNVPKSVQKRRIVLLFHRSSPIKDENLASSSSSSEQKQSTTEKPISLIQTKQSPIQSIDLTDNNIEAEMADSMQLAAILAQIQLGDDSNELLSNQQQQRQQQQHAILDPRKYEYVVPSPLETATYRLSPRTLKPDEELAARSRFSQYYRSEMRSSANAQIPPLMASIVTENNMSMTTNTDMEQIITFKLNSNEQISSNSNKSMENELVHLCYDATLKRFYDPNTGRYYELTSE